MSQVSRAIQASRNNIMTSSVFINASAELEE